MRAARWLGRAAARSSESGQMRTYLDRLWQLRWFLMAMAANDLRRRFHRSWLGIFYLVVAPLAFALVLGFVFSRIFGRGFVDYVPFVLSGILVWEMISGACLQGAHAIVGAEGYIRHYPLPFALYPLRTAISVFVQSLFALAVLLAWIVVLRPGFVDAAWWSLLVTLPLLFVITVALCVLFAVANTLSRDVAHFATIAFPAFWMISPITIPPDAYRNAGAGWLVDANPVYHLAELIRAPLLTGAWPPAHSLVAAIAMAIVATALAVASVALTGPRLVYRL